MSTTQPHITITPELASYLRKKGCRHIIVDFAQCKTCGGAVAEVFARVAKEKEASRCKEPSPQEPVRVFTASWPNEVDPSQESIEVIVVKRIIRADENVVLGLTHFLGIADIRIEGFHL